MHTAKYVPLCQLGSVAEGVVVVVGMTAAAAGAGTERSMRVSVVVAAEAVAAEASRVRVYLGRAEAVATLSEAAEAAVALTVEWGKRRRRCRKQRRWQHRLWEYTSCRSSRAFPNCEHTLAEGRCNEGARPG